MKAEILAVDSEFNLHPITAHNTIRIGNNLCNISTCYTLFKQEKTELINF